MTISPDSQTDTSAEALDAEELRKIDAYWRASLYLCVGMIFLRENPLLKEPLKMEHIKKRLLGHWLFKNSKFSKGRLFNCSLAFFQPLSSISIKIKNCFNYVI